MQKMVKVLDGENMCQNMVKILECNFGSLRDRPEISNISKCHAHVWFSWRAQMCSFLWVLIFFPDIYV